MSSRVVIVGAIEVAVLMLMLMLALPPLTKGKKIFLFFVHVVYSLLHLDL